MSWYKITQTADDVVDHKYDAPYWQLTKMQMAGSLPAGAAIYETNVAGPEPYTLYFSPTAARALSELLARLGATPCPSPKRSEVEMLLGGAFDSDFASE